MDIQAFKYKMTDYNLAVLNEEYILFKRKGNIWSLYNTLEDETEFYKGLNHDKLISLIEKLDNIQVIIEGGRGAGSNKKFGWTDMRKVRGDDGYNYEYPARANVRIKVKTQKNAIADFRRTHGNSKIEHSYQIDSHGFVHAYSHGNEASVRVGRILKGGIVVHNHPGNSTFSPTDMIGTAKTKSKGIIATYDKGYRQFIKGTHFKAEEFVKAVKRAQKSGLRGKNMDSAVDNWLKKNQKKYGYKFENIKD